MVQGVSAWNFDVAALKEQAQREGGLEPSLAPIIEGATSDMSAQTGSGSGEQGALLLIDPFKYIWRYQNFWQVSFLSTQRPGKKDR